MLRLATRTLHSSLALALSSLLAPTSSAAFVPAGDLDPSFGDGGVVRIPVTNASTTGNAVAIQPDGRIVLIANAHSGTAGEDHALVRVLRNGTLDPSFGDGGIVTGTRFDGGSPSDLVLQGDGRILVGGFRRNRPHDDWDFQVTRFERDGTLDSSFGVDGHFTIDFGSSIERVTGLLLQPDDKIIAVGETRDPLTNFTDVAVVRMRADGTLDDGFGTGGFFLDRSMVPRPGFPGRAAQTADGSIIIGTWGGPGTSSASALKLLPSGEVDLSFGSGGVATPMIPGANCVSQTLDVAVQADGKVVLTGPASTCGAIFGFLARLLPNGTPDTSFGAAGFVHLGFDFSQPEAIALQADGKVAVAGWTGAADTTFVTARVTSTGMLDSTYGDGGKTSTNLEGSFNRFHDLALEPDADIVGVGFLHDPPAASQIVLMRFAGTSCGDGALEFGEECDEAGANGATGQCCAADCAFASSGVVCREATGECDAAERCSGGASTCPHDEPKTNGAPCTDGDPCTALDHCGEGSCVAGPLDPSACLDDYVCYDTKPTKGFTKPPTSEPFALEDAFDARTTRTRGSDLLCAPASLAGSAVLTPETYAQRYTTKDPKGQPKLEVVRDLRVVDRFGTLRLDLVKPDVVAVPARLRRGGPPSPPEEGADDYHCFKVKRTKGSPKFPRGVTTAAEDPFEARTYNIKRPTRLCAPASLDGGAVTKPQAHLLCYAAKRSAGQRKHAKISGSIQTRDRFAHLRQDTLVEKEICVAARVGPDPTPSPSPAATATPTPVATATPTPLPTPSPIANEPVAVELTLSTSLVAAGSSLIADVRVLDGFGSPVLPQPTVDLAVEPQPDANGALPEVTGSTIETAAGATGAYTVHATHLGSGASASATFTILRETGANNVYASLSAAIEDARHALADASAAVTAEDVDLSRQKRDELAALRAQIDLERLEIAPPLAPDEGFVPTLDEVVSAGFGPTLADLSYRIALEEAVARVDLLIAVLEGIRPDSISAGEIAFLDAQRAALTRLADDFRVLDPTVYGIVDSLGELTILLGRRLPKAIALMLDIAVAGLDDWLADRDAVALRNGSSSLLAAIGRTLGGWIFADEAHAQLLGGLVGALAGLSPQAKLANEIYGPIFADVDNALLVLIAEELLKHNASENICAAVSGGSISVVLPDIPGSFVEGRQFNPRPELNKLVLIGPAGPEALTGFFDAIEDIFTDIDDADDVFGIMDAAETLAGGLDQFSSKPSSVLRDVGALCTFGAFESDQIILDEGFVDVLGDCTICLAPVLIVHYDGERSGFSYVRTNMSRPPS